MSDKKQTIRFKAVKVVTEPTTVSFKTKDGKKISFEATRAIEKSGRVAMPLSRRTGLKRGIWKRKAKTGMTGGKPRKSSKSATSGTKRVKRRIWTLKKADEQFSLWIRNRDNWTCKRCGKIWAEGARGLTCSHFWQRSHKGTRFDPENNDSACWMPCHKYHWEKEKQGDYRDFKVRQLGMARYQALEARARGTYPQDRAIIDCMKLLGHDLP